MAFLECIKSFGNFEPGDTVLVPDGAVFDTGHFSLLVEELEPVVPAAVVEEQTTNDLLPEEQNDKEEAE